MNNSTKKNNNFVQWISGNKSTTVLVVIFLLLLNLVCTNAFFRIDLTNSKSYSLSESSKTLVSTLEQPMSVKVFFTDNLPSPYNTTEQYLQDLLLEYKNNSNDNFDYTFFDMSNPENQAMASNYGLRQVQIQQVTDTEVGVKQAYMGLALMYADSMEVVDSLTASDGMEYKLTTAMSKMISNTSILAGLTNDVKMTLYISPKIGDFGITDFDKVDNTVVDALSSVNSANNNRISFERIVPTADTIQSLIDTYGLPGVSWKNDDETTETGTLGLVLEYGDSFRLVPLSLTRSLFGYAVTGLDGLDTAISDTLKSLVSKQVDVAYLTGHGEKGLTDSQSGAYNFKNISSDWYNFIGVDLGTDEIPTGVKTLIINGPSSEISDAELYKIDQFVMKGGNLLVFADPFLEVQDQQYAGYGMPPSYEPNPSNLEKLLNKYGVDVSSSFVMDENCYTSNDQQYGKLNYYYVPVVQQDTIDQDSVITAHIPYLYMLQNATVSPNFTEENAAGRTAKVLISSSEKAWELSENIMLSPMAITPPAESEMEAKNLAVLLSGKFSSAFDTVPEDTTSSDNKTGLNAHTQLSTSIQNSNIIVYGSSYITTSSIIDESGSSTTATLLRNSLDYLNGNADLCLMRTKGLSASSFSIDNPTKASLSKLFNQYGLPLLIVILGFIMWRIRIARRRKIQLRYYPEEKKDRLGEKAPVLKVSKKDVKKETEKEESNE